ncbi:mechanosensitive ion channel family protein [Paenochrobactrum pullorum]|uniref:mechanosensitive ion channel family protein n=1 Tax=Paenochrobactrum pullorum TaxID=1324351 RepID=UPI0035BBFA99
MTEYWIAAGIILLLTSTAFTIWFMMRRERAWSSSILAHIIYMMSLYGVILTLRQVVFMLLQAYKISAITPDMINTAAIAFIAILTLQQLFQLINRLTHAQIRKGSDPTSARMISRILKLSLFLFLILMFGEHFGIGLSGLLAFGGIGGIAIGVAGKDMLSNLFSGVMLYFDRPFNIGDWVCSPDRQIEGIVVEIGWRITKIITFDNRPLYVPNSLFSTISLENPGRMTNRRISTTIGLRYDDADKVAAVITDIRKMLKTNPLIDQSQDLLVYFNEFADSSLNIMVYCFTKTTHWAEWLDIQQNVYLQIIQIVQAHEADFAYPTQTLLINPEPAVPVQNPAANLSVGAGEGNAHSL